MKRNVYTSGAIGATMLKTACNMVPGTLAISGYNLADTYFVSRLGTPPLAAMGYTFPVIMLVNCLFHGLGTGVTATAAQAIGGGRHGKAARLITAGLTLMIGFAVGIGVIGSVSVDVTFRQFGARPEVMTLIGEYMTIWYLGCATAAVAMGGNGLLIAVGDSRYASMMMVAGMLLNVALDPLFIFTFGMGMRGAALATVLAQMASAVAMLGILQARHRLIDWGAYEWRVLKNAWGMVIKYAIPASIGMLLMPIGNAVVTKLLAGFGTAAVAAAAAAGRLEMLAFIFPMALGMSLMPMVGQNFGARLYSRIHECRRFAMRFALLFELAMAVIYFLAAPWLVTLFSDDPGVTPIMVSYLRIIPWGFGMIEVHRYSGFFFTGCARPRVTAWLNALRILGLLVPLSLLAAWYGSLDGLFEARLAADLLAGAVGIWLVRRFTGKLPEDGAAPTRL